MPIPQGVVVVATGKVSNPVPRLRHVLGLPPVRCLIGATAAVYFRFGFAGGGGLVRRRVFVFEPAAIHLTIIQKEWKRDKERDTLFGIQKGRGGGM